MGPKGPPLQGQRAPSTVSCPHKRGNDPKTNCSSQVGEQYFRMRFLCATFRSHQGAVQSLILTFFAAITYKAYAFIRTTTCRKSHVATTWFLPREIQKCLGQ
jgi:hypothetical protein